MCVCVCVCVGVCVYMHVLNTAILGGLMYVVCVAHGVCVCVCVCMCSKSVPRVIDSLLTCKSFLWI